MTRAVLDTHIFLWWYQDAPRHLSLTQKRLLERIDEEGEFVISVITLWEIAKLAAGKRIAIPRPLDLFLAEIVTYPRLHVEPLGPRILATSATLPNFHRDPADEIITATAYCLGLPLITSDGRIRKWAKSGTIAVV